MLCGIPHVQPVPFAGAVASGVPFPGHARRDDRRRLPAAPPARELAAPQNRGCGQAAAVSMDAAVCHQAMPFLLENAAGIEPALAATALS